MYTIVYDIGVFIYFTKLVQSNCLVNNTVAGKYVLLFNLTSSELN